MVAVTVVWSRSTAHTPESRAATRQQHGQGGGYMVPGPQPLQWEAKAPGRSWCHPGARVMWDPHEQLLSGLG